MGEFTFVRVSSAIVCLREIGVWPNTFRIFFLSSMITNGLPGVDFQIPSLGPRAGRIGVRTGLISSSESDSVEGR